MRDMAVVPNFLTVPARQVKPRVSGLTHLLDKGLPLLTTEAVLRTGSMVADIWKFGWGTAYLDPDLEPKLAALTSHGVRSCLGGTLLEVSWMQGKAKDCLSWAAEAGFDMVEVSRGVAPLTLQDKHELIRLASRDFVVLSEVGSKDPSCAADPEVWASEVAGDLSAGATLVVAEGRESGTVGLYDGSGDVKPDVADAIAAVAGPEKILFETPRKDQQAWFIRHFGAGVNLANIASDDLLGVEALRLGLRADTVDVSRPASS